MAGFSGLSGKCGKDAVVLLNTTINSLPRAYITVYMTLYQKLFVLKPSSISGEIESFAQKTKMNIHCHSLSHMPRRIPDIGYFLHGGETFMNRNRV